MPKYLIEEETLVGLGNAIRKVAGTDRTYTATEMIEAVTTILENGAYILVDENGNEMPAVFVDNDVTFTATANDIRLGTVAATEEGVTTGEKEIPAYHTTEGYKFVSPGSSVKIDGLEDYEYTKLQALFCVYDTSISNSVSTKQVCIGDSVYSVGSNAAIGNVTLDSSDQSIDFGISNETDGLLVVRYFMYKEIY